MLHCRRQLAARQQFHDQSLGQISLLRAARDLGGSALGLHRPAQSRPGAVLQLGGYMIGMYLMLMIGDLGQYHQSPICPISWSSSAGARCRPSGSRSTAFRFAVADGRCCCRACSRCVFGFLAFRSRIKGVYFSILTQALTYARGADVFPQQTCCMGGNNGFTDFKFILGYDLREPATQRGLYIATARRARCSFMLGCRWLSHDQIRPRAARHPRQRKPRAFQRLRDGELQALRLRRRRAHRRARRRALRAAGRHHQSRAKWRRTNRSKPSSGCAVGGRGTLIGPIIGAIGVNALKSWATRAYPDLWLIILGALFILVRALHAEGHRRSAGAIARLCKKRSMRRRIELAPNRMPLPPKSQPPRS